MYLVNYEYSLASLFNRQQQVVGPGDHCYRLVYEGQRLGYGKFNVAVSTVGPHNVPTAGPNGVL